MNLRKISVRTHGFSEIPFARFVVFTHDLRITHDLRNPYINITQEKDLLKKAFAYNIHNICYLTKYNIIPNLRTYAN